VGSIRRLTDWVVGWALLSAVPRLRDCGYSRLAPAGGPHGPINRRFQYPFLTSQIAILGYVCLETCAIWLPG